MNLREIPYITEIPHIGDILALIIVFPPFIYYFCKKAYDKKENLTEFEIYLLVIAILSFIADLLFTLFHYI